MNRPEHELQKNCVKWFDYQYPRYRNLRMKIDNEGKRSVVAGVQAKYAGLLPGAADLFIAVPVNLPNGIRPGLFIEFKSGKNKQTENQINFEKSVTSVGYTYAIVYSFDQFVKVVEKYLSQII